MSLARATLRHEWRRFLPGVLSVAFAGVLMLVQLGLLLGMFGTVTVLVDDSNANLWVSSPETQSFDQSREISAGIISLLRMNPAVQRTETLLTHDADWRSGKDVRVAVVLVEQKLTIALKVAQQVMVMGHGELVFRGTPEQLEAAPDVRRNWLEVA